ncbi:collagen-like protein [Lactiplantibacillus plantarum]|nr:collagen-like protein [Lactiplantibacillus plantarum]
MEKTLSFTDTSSQTVKIGDTTTNFTLVCGNDNEAVDLTHATSITVKFGNSSGYLKSAKIEPSKLTEPTNGEITVGLNADLMKSLPAGGCYIEVWVVDSTGTSIYPSDGSTGFTITNNIQSTTGEVITTIAFDEFVKAMNKAASTIAKGDKGEKGDTGTVDNDGLTKAPAFVELKTQVDNSAVGTNLVTNSNFSSELNNWKTNPGTKSDCKAVATTDSGGDTCIHITGTGNLCGVYFNTISFNQNQVMTGSVLAKGTGKLAIVGLNGRTVSNFGTISTGSYSKICSTTQASSNTSNFCIYFNPVNNVVDMYIKFAKLEIGSYATDWSPNPSEILTQSDYAKLQAAIVSLGGHLS